MCCKLCELFRRDYVAHPLRTATTLWRVEDGDLRGSRNGAVAVVIFDGSGIECPDSCKTNGVIGAVSEMVRVPVNVPRAVPRKTILTVHDSPGATAVWQVFVCLNGASDGEMHNI
jgi:hypothetical protein